MENIYARVERFYQAKPEADLVLPQRVLERYLRRQAWHGKHEQDLQPLLEVIATTLTLTVDLELDTLEALSVFDYQELLYRYQQQHPEFDFSEKATLAIFAKLKAFYSYLAEKYDVGELLNILTKAQDSLYVDGVFTQPPYRQPGDFYSSLEHREELSEADLAQLNVLLDELLQKICDYFQDGRFWRDLDRASALFFGPHVASDDERMEGFWDYFLFDYHMLFTDDTPLHYYFDVERESLSVSEYDVLQDLLAAEFTVFTVLDDSDEVLTCQNMFTDELIELPAPEGMVPDFMGCVCFGHVHAHGVMLMNYITALPASERLSKRMQEVVEHLFAMFRYQQPGATLKDFFVREAIVVRHALWIMSRFAQLALLPQHDYIPAPLPKQAQLMHRYREEEQNLRHLGMVMQFSAYAQSLLVKLFEDYCVQAKLHTHDEMQVIMPAAIMLFLDVNGVSFIKPDVLCNNFAISPAACRARMQKIAQTLKVNLFDPRYLTEEGFVNSLYLTDEAE